MNDRFKFRVWDDVNNKYVNKGILLRCGDLAIPSMKNDYDMNPVDGRYSIEQCTGLKDKNGKLIYEGDIVEHKILPDKSKRYIVKWSYTHLCFELQSTKNQLFYDVFIPAYDDVIGNIHENPELLKESK
ncbi:MAG: hypothetical protein J6S67_25925 [Methanobrevibacter sp.]|nr:hypothetical protein [Methanobrevibacter sp.]